MYAWKDGVTGINAANMNSFLALQSFQLIYEGTSCAAKTGIGVVENSIANYSYCTGFTLMEATEISRVELELDRDNLGADLVVQIRSGMVPSIGLDGTLLKQVVVPKEFIPDPKGYWSVPIGLAGLTEGVNYWLMVVKVGDSTNKVDWIGETSQDGSYPAYQRVNSPGEWTLVNSLHFKVFSGESGELIHGIYAGTGYTTVAYDANGQVSKIHRYLPPVDTTAGGIRDTLTLNWVGEYLKNGVVT